MTDLRVALLGAGVIARSSHLPAWHAATGATITHVIDRDLATARRVAHDWGIPAATDEIHLAYEAVDAVDICLPPPAHVEATIDALDHGLHVLVEKPLSLDRAGGERIRRARDAANRTVMVAENWVFASAARAARDTIRAGDIGGVFLVRTEHLSALYLPERHPEQPAWLVDAVGAGGGYLLNAGIHNVNLCRDLVGEINAVSVVKRDRSPDDEFELDLVAAIEFDTGAIGTLTCSGRSAHHGQRRMTLEAFGTEGTVALDILRGTVDLSRADKAERIAPPTSMGFTEEVAHFVTSIANGAPPLTSVEHQLRTMDVVEAMYASARTGARADTRIDAK